VCLNLQLWFTLFVTCLFQGHRTLELPQISGYSLNQQCWILYNWLHKRIAINFFTFLRQIQHSLSLIIHGWKDRLSDIKLIYSILWHPSCIPGVRTESSRIFPRSGMQLRHTQIHSPVEVDGLRFDAACLFYSKAKFNNPPLIFNTRSHSRHASELCIPTLHYPWTIHFAPFQAYFLPSWMLWICGCQLTQSVHLADSKVSGAGAAHPAWPELISKSMVHQYVMATAEMPSLSCSISANVLEDGDHHTLTVDGG